MPSNYNQDEYQSQNLQQSVIQNSSSVSSKPQKHKQRTKLYYFLQKINDQSIQKKRQCIIDYLNNNGQLKDFQKSIKTIQKQVNHIPALQVALSLGKHNNNILQQFLQSNKKKFQSIKQNPTNLLTSKPNSFIQLINTQPQSNLKSPTKQPSFHEYKIISPTKVKKMIDVSTGKFRQIKKQKIKYVQYPKQLKQLKNQLYSLPCLGKNRRNLLRMKTIGDKRDEEVKSTQVRHLNQLNKSFRSTESFNKKKKQFIEKEKLLENTLNQVLQKRLSNIVQNKTTLPSIKPSMKSTFKMGQKTISSISVNSKFQYNSPLQNRHIYSEQYEQNPQKMSLIKSRRVQYLSSQLPLAHSYWPSYPQYSPHNNPTLQQQSSHLQSKITSLMQFPSMPNQQTIKMYFNLKKFQQQDLQQLKHNSYKQQKLYSMTKYKMKFKQIKENNKRNFMQYVKEKKRRNFQEQKLDMIEMNNMAKKQIKLNGKLLERVELSAASFIQNSLQ